MSLFEVYEGVNHREMAVAAEVTQENLSELGATLHATVESDMKGFMNTLVFTDTANRLEQRAEVGDYIVSDMVGGFLAVDKEMFEAHYKKQS